MPGFEEEAFRRAQQISRPRVVKERAETVREPEKPKPKPEVKEEQKAELPNINNSEKEIHVINRKKENTFSDITISEIAKISKEEGTDIIELLREHFNVTEVRV